MSVPRPVLQGGIAGFPQPLAPSDAARLRRIFDLQARGEATAAARETERLEDRRLIGHVLADRWLRGHDAAVPDLIAWLGAHADHPDAPAIHALLVRKAPRGAALPPVPEQSALPGDLDVVPEEREPASRTVTRNASLDRSVRDRARDGDIAAALAQIARSRAGGAYAALLRADVAQIALQLGRDEEALRIATDAARNAGGTAFPAFVAGLAAWSLGRHELALTHFEAAARADIASPATRSAAAFWAARASIRARRPQQHIPWLLQAAQEPRTFYGLVARRTLGLPMGFAWERELAGESEAAAVAETAAGWRALALLQVGQRDRAEAEMRALWPRVQGNPGVARAVLVVASHAGMTDFAAQVASLQQSTDGRPRDFARFPLPRLQPNGGFRIDPALLYALARQESNFDPDAVSPSGARGLLQIMPATASYVTGDPSLRGAGARRLHDPSFALEVGQRYVHYLARHGEVGGDLIRLLAAYNAGPGNLGRWQPTIGHRDDPFLFIESIPVGETRLFVQRVLAYSWIYASRLGLPAPSLDALAAGRFPRFSEEHEVAQMVARRQ
ncbi:lytic transglycosylase domain-containing protein [Falsiroseomonas oryziterrae]|uniref:lytic transglycosylase domain-containing protein n=1 Tax=Falsiroseomonas oryziterrae TaxID=2911368 RepID=UPI001F3481C7|nr:lytic transglycosylase domain-containing protein [Roseomonas sp. NPKOSM-4]